jgi:hypothetical protein
MRTLTFVALIAAAIVFIASAQARAGSPCCCAAPCVVPAPHVHVYKPYDLPQIYIVNQGPVYSGPWIYARPKVVLPRQVEDYPYVAYDYPYPVMYPVPRRYRHPIRVRY